jgi:Flp pilus assembly protein TadD
MRGNFARFGVAVAFTLLTSGCLMDAKSDDPETALAGPITDTSSFGSGPEQVWLDKAKVAYRNGNFGLAERYYRQAIEERHNNAEAWLGLAASYDQLKRFDHADRAYEALIKITGRTPTVLNNLAYHQMLKGDFAAARRSLAAAAHADPKNPFVRNNMEILEKWEAKARKTG